MNKIVKRILIFATVVLFAWAALTVWVEGERRFEAKQFGGEASLKRALIVYNPDPIYDLDKQVCESFGKTLVGQNWHVTIASASEADKLSSASHDLYVVCANTYNWAPDWPVSNFIERNSRLAGKQVVAITLGSGSTKRSQRLLENLIQAKKANLVGSKTFWLLRPNDEKRMEEGNVSVVLDMINNWAIEIDQEFFHQNGI